MTLNSKTANTTMWPESNYKQGINAKLRLIQIQISAVFSEVQLIGGKFGNIFWIL